MRERASRWLIFIIAIALIAAWIVWPQNPGIHLFGIDRSLDLRLGLDLRGGLEVLLEADTTGPISRNDLEAARVIINRRINALGVAEPLIQVVGNNRISVNIPGLQDPEAAIASIRQTGLLEFVDPAGDILVEDQTIQTDCAVPQPGGTCLTAEQVGISATPPVTAAAPITGTALITPTAPITGTAPVTPTGKVYHTVMTGAILADARPSRDEIGRWQIQFTLTSEGSRLFADYTSQHVGENLAIVLDKKVLSAPRIQSAITGGRGVITGNFTADEARRLADLLKYGALPVPFKIIKNSTIGPTLGEDSVRQSLIAGVVGLLAVATFMIAYYRLPGVLAVAALLIYATITIALFKLIPVTLTLPGIFGFILSIGVAVDANVLIFERMKEELRGGRRVDAAVDAGFARAWPSIRDSNVSTIITCIILFWFGSTFGASIVQGFAVTLFLGVAVSLFTAITVTRTFLHLVLDRVDFSQRHAWFGV
jgi:preprotein translocase subunit SecD